MEYAAPLRVLEAISLLSTKERTQKRKGDYTMKMDNIVLKEGRAFLANTANNQPIYANEATLRHMEAHSDVALEHIIEAITKVDSFDGQFFMGTVDLGRVIGKSTCVQVTEEDWAKGLVICLTRKGRKGETPFVLNREPEDTRSLTLGMCIDREDGYFKLFTAFYGVKGEREPWDPNIKTKEEKWISQKFWKEHALVYDKDAIDWETCKPRVSYLLPRDKRSVLKHTGEFGVVNTVARVFKYDVIDRQDKDGNLIRLVDCEFPLYNVDLNKKEDFDRSFKYCTDRMRLDRKFKKSLGVPLGFLKLYKVVKSAEYVTFKFRIRELAAEA
ncbi:MAG: hypothetical protein K6A45_01625 [Lachnospiraceae bacterium]|nr:hypothetical protein [Lachnospiraceae bacterium]